MIPNSKSSTVTMTANSVSASVGLPVGGGDQLIVFNRGPADGFIEVSNNANLPAVVPAVGTPGSFLIAANQPATVIGLKGTETFVSAVSSGNAQMFFSRAKII